MPTAAADERVAQRADVGARRDLDRLAVPRASRTEAK